MSSKRFIVVPTYNERNNIGLLVPLIFSIIPEINILVVDDSSPDKTADVVREMMKKYPNLEIHTRPTKNGIGGAYIEGFQKLLMDPEVSHIIMMDADFQHDPKYLPELLQYSEDFDLVIGSRHVLGGGELDWPLKRRLLHGCSRIYTRLLLGSAVKDWGAGYNCIKTNALHKLNLNSMNPIGYEFIIALKYRLVLLGATVKEIPVLLPGRREGESKVTAAALLRGLLVPWRLLFNK